MNESSVVVPAAGFKDRSHGLIGYGILMILIGCLCALLVPLMFLGQAMAARTTGASSTVRMILPSAMMYTILAVVFVWLGIGSIMARRWARALLLILSWAWLFVGAMTELVVVVLLPDLFTRMPRGGGPAATFLVGVFALSVVTPFLVILPGASVLFYRSRHVRATCEARDPVPRWTDACPLPVLALSLFLICGAVCMAFVPLCYHGVTPFFGSLLSGLPGTVLILAVIAVCVCSAWASYHLNPAGWWTILIAFGLVLVSALLTFSRVDILDIYRSMGYSEQQIALIQKYRYLTNQNMLVFTAIASFPFLGYLLFVKRYFH
ncbi:MAG TPA: hypothetical protein VMV72_01735 [Verrucomicrobiae bacterium]|nr:hypothetical protein [Verrucomicrobiae bacterium]